MHTATGVVPISSLRLYDEVLSWSRTLQQFVFSEVIMFLDIAPNVTRSFYQLTTESGAQIELTDSHLIYVGEELTETYASQVNIGDVVYVRAYNASVNDTSLVKDVVRDVQVVQQKGYFAPLTDEGNLVVDEVLVSCYAEVASERVADWALLPYKFANSLFGKQIEPTEPRSNGVHWYANFLHTLGRYILPRNLMYSTAS